MTITTLSSREFNRDASRAKKAAKEGPVFITARGRPAHVLLSIEEYGRLTGATAKIADLLALPGVEDIEFEAPRARDLPRVADLRLMSRLGRLESDRRNSMCSRPARRRFDKPSRSWDTRRARSLCRRG